MNHERPEIACGPRDDNGRRLAVIVFGGQQHRDTLDTNSSYSRKKFRETAINKLRLGEEAHRWIEDELVAKADAADAGSEDPPEKPLVRPMSDYRSETVSWLWTGYVPAAAITIVDGDLSLGKSQLTCDLAARVTSSRRMPDGSTVPVGRGDGVVMLSAEDDPNRTIKPRLEAAGAACERVLLFAGVESFDGNERGFTLPRDVGLLEEVITEHRCALVVVDPFVAYLSADLSMNSDADCRRALKPLAAMAERTGAAVLMLRHLNKKSGDASMYRGGGSIGITGAARAAFVVAKSDHDPDVRVVAPIKMNLAPMPKAMEFSVEPHGSTSRVRWGEASNTSADDLLSKRSQGSSGGKTGRAAEIMSEVLAQGPRGEREVLGAIEAEGISKSTYWRARKALGIKSEKTDFGGGEWLLSMPNGHAVQCNGFD